MRAAAAPASASRSAWIRRLRAMSASAVALAGAVDEPAWKGKPSWYLVAADDRMIRPPAQRFMAERAGAEVSETGGSHAVYVSKPEAVAEILERAAVGAMADAG